MRVLQAVLVVMYSFMLWHEVRRDLTEYASFKLLTETADRQKRYRGWVLRGLLIFSGSALVGLILLGQWHTLMSMPTEFNGFAQALRKSMPDVHFSKEFLLTFGSTLFAGAVLGGVIAAKIVDQGGSAVVGDIEPLMPRTWAETGYTMLLALNAGLGEELLFRLFLPLLLALLSGSATFAFVTAALVFGLMHVYQGVFGVLMTMVLGCILTAIYLVTGSIWVAIAIHAGIDVMGLVVRPTVVRFLRTDRVNVPSQTS